MAVAANEEELQFILSLDDTDVDKDDQASPSIRQSTNSFTVNELISVLERISSSMIKPEVALAKAILLNTRGKELFTALDCFVSAFVEAFRQCNDFVQNVKGDSIRAIKLEREFSTLRNGQKTRSNLWHGHSLQEMLILRESIAHTTKKEIFFKRLSNHISPKDRFIYVVAILGFAKISRHGNY